MELFFNLETMFSKKILCGECGTLFLRKVTTEKVYWVCKLHDTDKTILAFNNMYNKLKKIIIIS